jgi:hypothetical protein
MSTRTTSLLLPRLLVVAGLVGLVTGTTVEVLTFYGVQFSSELFIYLAMPLGYCVVGLAWWQLLAPGPPVDPAVAKRLRRFSRTLAVAATVTAIGYLAGVYGNLRFRYSWPNDQGGFYIRHFRTMVACPAVIAIGLLLAAAGFWIASYFTESTEVTRDESDMVGAGL